MSGHTELPWRVLPNRNIVDRRGHFVANVQLGISSTNFDEMEAKGALIVTACNSHADLVKALEKIEYALRKDSLTDAERVQSARTLVTAALATLTARKVG